MGAGSYGRAGESISTGLHKGYTGTEAPGFQGAERIWKYMPFYWENSDKYFKMTMYTDCYNEKK